MNIQRVENNQIRVDFKSKHHKHDKNSNENNSLESASAFVNMDDAQLKDFATAVSYDPKTQEKRKNKLFGLFCAVPIVDTIASAIVPALRTAEISEAGITKGNLVRIEGAPLGIRAFSAARTAGIWGLGLGVVAAYTIAKNALVSHSSSTKQFTQDHPTASLFVDLGAIFGGFILAQNGVNKFGEKLSEKAPLTAEKVGLKLVNIYNKLNNSKFNKKTITSINESMEELTNSMPNTVKFGKGLVRNSALILMGVGLYKMFSYVHKDNKKIEKNFNELKNEQFEAAKYLANAKSVECDVLAQDQPKLANDLRREMNKTVPVEQI